MPRNVAVNDLRTYQMENPSTPDDFKVISYGEQEGNPFWQSLHDENSVRRNRFLAFTKINYEVYRLAKCFCSQLELMLLTLEIIKFINPGTTLYYMVQWNLAKAHLTS